MEELKTIARDIDKHLAAFATAVAEAMATVAAAKSKQNRFWDVAQKFGVWALGAYALWNVSIERRVLTLETTRAPLIETVAKTNVKIDELQRLVQSVSERLIRMESREGK